MSDDEEIIYKGKNVGLYSYLTDLGYADFETFESENCTKGEQFQLPNNYSFETFWERLNNAVSRPNTYKITNHDHRKLVAILKSQLLFKEDANTVESLLLNKHVSNLRPNYVFHSSIVLTGLLSSLILFKSRLNFGLGLVHCVVPAGLTFMFSCYSAWQFYKEYDENRKDFVLMTHINDLKKLCFNILKLTRFIKETEILSSGHVSVHAVGSILYVPTSKHDLADIDGSSAPWKTLPHLRKSLLDAVEEGLNILTVAVNSLRQCFYDSELVENHLSYINGDYLKPCQPSGKGSCSVRPTLVDLKDLSSKYLCVQSEYLKELAFIFSPLVFKDNISKCLCHTFARDKVLEMCMNLHNKLTDISFKLMMQYNIHNIASTFKKVSYKSSSMSHMREINEVQNGVHNVFLLLYSALLRVRNLEDTLENLSEMAKSPQTKDKLSLDVTEQLTILRDDLKSTLMCYDVLCQQAMSKDKDETTRLDAENESSMIELNIKETGIVVGTSDFAVNSPDEVFLSSSGLIDNDETSISTTLTVDDWCLERRPQIPKSLLTELSQTLKSRKTDFIEREKLALKRKGLQDIDNMSPSGDEESDEKSDDSFSTKQGSMKYKRYVAAHDYSHSSDSDDEMDPFESGSFLTKLKISKKYQSEPYSDSDSSVLSELSNKTIGDSEVTCNLSVSTSSLANMAALKSQMWRKNKEEYYSDGNES